MELSVVFSQAHRDNRATLQATGKSLSKWKSPHLHSGLSHSSFCFQSDTFAMLLGEPSELKLQELHHSVFAPPCSLSEFCIQHRCGLLIIVFSSFASLPLCTANVYVRFDKAFELRSIVDLVIWALFY